MAPRARKTAEIPLGAWPRRMNAAYAAGYVGEPTVESFKERVGREYPGPIVNSGRRQLWLRDDLDRAIGVTVDGEGEVIIDAATIM